MIGLIVYIGTAFGLAYIVGHSKISLPARTALAIAADNWPLDIDEERHPAIRNRVAKFILDLSECVACFGFWIGLVAGFGNVGPPEPVNPFALALLTTASNLILGKLTGLIGE